jgi:hypothetical protein
MESSTANLAPPSPESFIALGEFVQGFLSVRPGDHAGDPTLLADLSRVQIVHHKDWLACNRDEEPQVPGIWILIETGEVIKVSRCGGDVTSNPVRLHQATKVRHPCFVCFAVHLQDLLVEFPRDLEYVFAVKRAEPFALRNA